MNKPTSISDLLGAGALLMGIEPTGKKQLLQDLARHAASALGLEEHILFDVLWEREKLGTTGVGAGIAIPHGRIPGLQEVRGFFARLKSPIPYESVDDRPVDLVFLLLAPEEAGADHLHALAAVSRSMRDVALCDQLRKAKDPAALSAALRQAPAVEAA